MPFGIFFSRVVLNYIDVGKRFRAGACDERARFRVCIFRQPSRRPDGRLGYRPLAPRDLGELRVLGAQSSRLPGPSANREKAAVPSPPTTPLVVVIHPASLEKRKAYSASKLL